MIHKAMGGYVVKHFTIGRVGLALLATAVVCLSQAAVASAGGNSANAKLCQMTGWQTLVRSNGSSFTNEGACVSYAANGGTLIKKSQFDCQSFGGTYSTDPATDMVNPGGEGIFVWSCNGYEGSRDTLENDCLNDTGGSGGLGTFFPMFAPLDSTCYQAPEL